MIYQKDKLLQISNEVKMKKLFKAMLMAYSLMLLLVYLKLLPNPSDFFITRDIILGRRERGFWQFNFIPFKSYFYIGENFPANLWIILGHIGLAFVWGILLALSFKNLTVKKCTLYSLVFFVLIEVIQFAAAAGAFDIDTVIQHWIGAVAGSAVVLKFLSKKAEEKRNNNL